MANEDKRVSAPQAQMSSGCRIAVNIVSFIVVIIASFAAGFAVSTLVQQGQNDRDGRPDLNQMRQMPNNQNMPSMPGNNNQNERPNLPQRNNQQEPSSDSKSNS